MIKEKLSVGIMGYGIIGQVHGKCILGIDDLVLCAVADTNPENRARVPQGTAVYEDYRELLHTGLDLNAVVVALPTKLHKQAVSEIIQAGKGWYILLEKPMGKNVSEAEDISKKVEQSPLIKLMAGMTGRYHPEFAAGYNAIEEGCIGEILFIDERLHMGDPSFPRQYLSKDQCGRGVGLTNGIHSLDRFRWYTGQEITGINVIKFGNELFHVDVEDMVIANVEFSEGLTGRVSLRFSPHKEFDYVCEVVGTRGILRVFGFDRAELTRAGKTEILYQHDTSKTLLERHEPGIKAELEAFRNFCSSSLISPGNTHSSNMLLVADAIEAQKAVELFYAGQ